MRTAIAGRGLLICGALAVGAWMWTGSDEPKAVQPEQSRQDAAAAVSLPGRPTAAPTLAPAGPHDPAAFERWMSEQSSLRGVVLDGAWDIDADGRLQATVALRRRFDQLLTLVGEASVEEISAYIEHDVREMAGANAVPPVMALWRRYLELQHHAFATNADMRDRATWAAALAERQQVRRRLLGDAVAAAFFADDEAQLQAALATSPPPAGVAYSPIDRTTLSPQAAERLRQEEVAWADWELRMAEAQREYTALQARTELSAPQRAEAMERLIVKRFDSSEAVRVRALLRLPPATAAGG